MKIIDINCFNATTLPFNFDMNFYNKKVVKKPDAIQKQEHKLGKLEEKSTRSISQKSSMSDDSYSRCSSRSNDEKIPERFLKEISNWKQYDVQIWVNNVCYDYDLPKPYPVDSFLMNGKGLLLLRKEDFIHRSPLCGDILYECFSRLQNDRNKQPKKTCESEIGSLTHSNSSVQSISSCESSEMSLVDNISHDKVQNKIPIKKPESVKNTSSFASDYEILNQFDNNLYSYLNYLNESFRRDTTRMCSTNNANNSDFTFGIRTKKVVYNLNSEQMNLYANLNKNKHFVRAI